MILPLVLLVAALGLYMAWNIGANDVANSMAVSVGSKALSVRRAVLAAAICEFAGAVLVGAHVTDTIRKGIVDPQVITQVCSGAQGEAAAVLVIGMAGALLAAAIWLHVSSWMGLPVSTTHSIVGAVAGFGMALAGLSCVNWGKMGQIVASWLISPVAGGVLAFLVFHLVSKLILGQEKPAQAAAKRVPLVFFFVASMIAASVLYKGMGHMLSGNPLLSGYGALLLSLAIGFAAALVSRGLVNRWLAGKFDLPMEEQIALVERIFTPAVIATSCSVAFAHGANDVANAVGPMAAVVYVLRNGDIGMRVPVPFWMLGLGGLGIVFGLATYGYRVMYTVGSKITHLTPSRGVAADLAAAATVLVCSRLKLPVSTTHTLVGAIIGIGLARGLAGINGRVTLHIFGSWLITVPAAMVLSIAFFVLGHHFLLEPIRQLLLH